MEPILSVIAIIAVIVGTCFSVIGVLGYFRLPDVYTRLHLTGKVSVFGVVNLLIAAAVWTPVGWGEALVLIFFYSSLDRQLPMPWDPRHTASVCRVKMPSGMILRMPLVKQADKD